MDRQRPLTTNSYRTRARRAPLAVTALALLAPFALGTPPATAASHRLSQGLPFSDVVSPELSPDGRFAVYTHDAEVDQALELWSVRVAGGTPVRLTNPLPSGIGVSRFEISADSQRVVYTVAQETAGQIELYSIPIAGPEGAWVKLNGELPSGGDVDSFSFSLSPDSTRVVYLADQVTDSIWDAWTVPIDGGTSTRLRPPFFAVGSEAYGGVRPVISPDSERVFFLANFSALDAYELWSARVDGTGGLVQLTEGEEFWSTDWTVSPDSTRVLYVSILSGNLELYSVPSAGGSAVKLNSAMPSGGNVAEYHVSPDSSRVVYLADQQTDEVFELYSVPLAGGGATKLNDVLPSWGGADFQYAISPDGARVVYRAIRDVAGVTELFSVPLAGGAVTKLNPSLPSGRAVEALAIAPDSSRVVYRADQRLSDVQELFSVPLTGGTSIRVSDDPVVGGNVTEFEIAPGSDFVFYRGDIQTDGRHELFRGRIASLLGADDQVSGPMVSGGEVGQNRWAMLPDGRQAIYRADQEVDEQDDLYVGDICLLCDGFEAGDSERWD